MIYRAQASLTMAVPASALWDTIAAMTGMEVWYPALIASSDVTEHISTEPRRRCVLQGGGELHERILVRDAATRTFVYAIDRHPLPARNLVGTLRVADLGEGRSHVVWDAQMDLDNATAEEILPMITGMYEAGLASLEAHHVD